MEDNTLIIFKGKNIRRLLYRNEWWFSVVDVVAALTNSPRARTYWTDLKRRVSEDEGFTELHAKCVQLKLKSSDGKMYATDCANTETLFRLIQSIPSPKAEPFKLWLAKVGYDRVKEIEDPELATKRTLDLYKAKGYSDQWIDARMRGIAVHDKLTDEWDNRGIKEDKEYAILTAEIAKATFGMTPSQHKKYKGLQSENLRDHMSDLELIFSMLGEASTTKIAREKDAQGFKENKDAAIRGGRVAGIARKQLELEGGEKVVSKDNFLPLKKTKKIQ
ncbi:MAG: Bro-N domain-containing protein [Alphaproteobacteria bacterium]|nr:Bro-N domain-containing protein [Alphaproteobacteria bacterium]